MSLFGGITNPQAFGAPIQNQPMQQGQGLFGNQMIQTQQAQSQQNPSLFGGAPGNQIQGQQQGGLFSGNQQKELPSLFGQTNSFMGGNQSLFGQQQQNTQLNQPQTSAFGTSQNTIQNQQGAGLFGGQPQQQNQAFGLFGQQNQNQQNQQIQPQQSSGLFGVATGASTSLFGGQQQPQQQQQIMGQQQQGMSLFNQQQPLGNASQGGVLFGKGQPQQQLQQNMGFMGQGINQNMNNMQQGTQGSLFGNIQTNQQMNQQNQAPFQSGMGGFQQGGLTIGTNFNQQQKGFMGQAQQALQNTFQVKFDVKQTLTQEKKPANSSVKTLVHAINFMPQYKGMVKYLSQSILELRVNDYKLIKQKSFTPEVAQMLQRIQTGQPFQQQPGLMSGLMAQTQAPQTIGGLFGQQSQPQQQSGGLFGQNTGQQGIFGSQTLQNPQGQTSSLFSGQQQPVGILGQPNQQQSSGGLFGNTQGGGLFGNTTTAQPSTNTQGGGLFGQSTQQPAQLQTAGGGLFGNVAQQQPTNSGGLFSNSTIQPQGGGLFGSQTAQPSIGGLFGSQAGQQSTTTGGLFSGSITQNSGGGLFGNQPQANTTSSLFGNTSVGQQQTGSLFGGAFQQNISILQNLDPLQSNQQVSNFLPTGIDWTELSKEFNKQSQKDISDTICLSYKKYDTLNQSLNQDSVQYFPYQNSQSFINKPSLSFAKEKKSNQKEQISEIREKHCDMSKIQNQSFNKQKTYNEREIIESNQFNKDLLESYINFTIKIDNPEPQIIKMKINSEEIIKDVKSLILQQIFGRGGSHQCKLFIQDLSDDYKIVWQPKNKPQIILNERNLVGDYEMQKDEEAQLIQLDSCVRNLKLDLASEEELPILTKLGYQITPPLFKLARFTSQQLSRVEDLSIENEYVRIQWTVPIDVRGVNFDKCLKLSNKFVEIYPDETEGHFLILDEKPEVGDKLNNPAIITFFNFQIKDAPMDQEKFMKRLQKWIVKNDMSFISYESETEILTVKVQHF